MECFQRNGIQDKLGRGRWLATAVALLSLSLASALGQQTGALLESDRALEDGNSVREISLNGEWAAGIDRRYDHMLRVPGLATDPSRPTAGTLWYKRTVAVPNGQWTRATLTLKGARFAPQVYVDGKLVSSAEGGMAATVHGFALPAGKSFTLEIALQSLQDLDAHDASAVPAPDLWRSNVSSYLWDSVLLRLHRDHEIVRVTPSSDLAADSVSLHWELSSPVLGASLRFKLLDAAGNAIVTAEERATGDSGTTALPLQHRVQSWSPESPHLYRLRSELRLHGQLLDAREQSFGLRSFATRGLGFQLNGEPYHLRMGTVVWHRWTRDPEAKDIAFDPVWFERNVVLRLKGLGANALRFHLGLPPEEFLDLCDRDGLAVQIEWPFFHGLNASEASLQVQWRAWLDTAMRHPSVVIIQAWNETGESQVKTARGVLDAMLREYPPLVVDHRDVTPVHKYWWSLFENVGLYYDSADQFGQPVMVDEFGGDYLDEFGNPGGYPATQETFLRFLGHDNTREERLQLQSDANARIAEYWRRLGVAGFAPFCILSSPQDGNNWFMGPSNIPAPLPKPVWAAMAAAWEPQSLSLELWNRNFSPGETIHTPLWFFNDSGQDEELSASIHIIDENRQQDAMPPMMVHEEVKAYSSLSVPLAALLPARAGEWRIEARLDQKVADSTPIISSWHIRTFVPAPTAVLHSIAIGVPENETELRAMLEEMNLKVVPPSNPDARILVGSSATWKELSTNPTLLQQFDTAMQHGKSIVLLDAGPQPLGVGYESGKQRGGPLEGSPDVKNPAALEDMKLFGGVHVLFRETAEPESTLQEPAGDEQLWNGLPRQAAWLWNGLRGGLIVPAADMQVAGLSGKALLTTWEARGAPADWIKSGKLYAYELAGYYEFADRGDDQSAAAKLRQRVKLIVDDAPALAGTVNPNASINVTDVGALYSRGGSEGQAERVSPLAEAGKNLSRTPVVRLSYGPGTGNLVLSQLLTNGRLLPDHAEPGPGVYGLRYDPVAVQFVLNMLSAALEGN